MLTLVKPDDPVLLRTAEPVGLPLSATIRKLATNMLPMMLQNRGCGLAAPQVGESVRLFTFFHNNTLGQAINPEIITRSPEMIDFIEGCLTYPDRRWKTRRSQSVTVRYTDLTGSTIEVPLTGLLGVIFQHEIDHLDGVLISQHGVEETG